ncbi:MAG: hypothetical protein IAF94_20410 [Pirellulaceae bacterium]|nr:hypothetical protein [Pirellulaceae bacterium]
MTPSGCTQLTLSDSNSLPNQTERKTLDVDQRPGIMSDPDFNEAWVGPTIRTPPADIPRQPR